jgi:CubicO group peptidase (beta-lactamase class C family)
VLHKRNVSLPTVHVESGFLQRLKYGDRIDIAHRRGVVPGESSSYRNRLRCEVPLFQHVLQDGVWEGSRILPEGWVKYSTTPTPKAPKGEYGALFWLNAGPDSDPGGRRWPMVSRDAYSAEGFQYQRVIIIPSRKLVLVRLGASSGPEAWNSQSFIQDVLSSFAPP